jgi:hypothetical protein
VQPQALVLWLSADVGVTCDQSTPPRVTGWQDRRAGSTVTLSPGLRMGPRCDGTMLAGHPLPYFDKPSANIDDGVLPVNLTALDGKSYTVLVVERRRAADARAILGTDVPAPTMLAMCPSDNSHLAYRFGYRSATLFSGGSYTGDADENCLDPTVTVPALATPTAVLSVDRLDSTVSHTIAYGSVQNPSDDIDPMTSLMQGYLGRAYQSAAGDSRYVGEIAEVVIYSVALTSTEVTSVSTYLRTRWNF